MSSTPATMTGKVKRGFFARMWARVRGLFRKQSSDNPNIYPFF
jgi:hypothetical protein